MTKKRDDDKVTRRVDHLADVRTDIRERAQQRKKIKVDVEPGPESPPVSAGAIDRIVDMVGNPSRNKIREVTSIDRVQGRLLPQLDIIDLMWQHLIEIAVFRQDADEYEQIYNRKRPIPPNLIDEFTYRTAQWQKSVAAMNLKSLMDLALAETEARAGEDDEFRGTDAWKD